MSANFIDHIRIWVKSGDGGAGSVHFRRERFIPKGGPDGGNGGNGGNIILKGDNQLHTLLHLRYKKHIKAENGSNGQGSNKYGDKGNDIYIKVPLGTVIKEEDNESKKIEILEHEQEYIIAKGGKGGLGNSNFKSSTNQTPRYAQPGIPGEEKCLIFELKILADVGLVGLPNAGKSSLLASLSAAKPKIANYPFTTLIPNIGMIPYYENKSFIMADIPGIIEGAAKGRGLGTKFLRHIERNAVLLFVIDAESESIKKTYNLLINELNEYNIDLLFKEKLLAISKSDLLDEEMIDEIKKHDMPDDIDHIFISSKNKLGLENLKNLLWDKINT